MIAKKKVCVLAGAMITRHWAKMLIVETLYQLGYDITVIFADKKEKTGEVKTEYGNLICLPSWFVKMPIVDFPVAYLIKGLEQDYDFYFVIDSNPILAAYFLKKFGKKVIYWIGDDNASLFSEMFAIIFPRLKFMKRILRNTYVFFEKRICNNFDAVITLTKSLEKDRKDFKTRIYTIYRGTSPNYFQRGEETVSPRYMEGKKIIAFVGEISILRGLNHMLESFSNVVKEIPDSMLLMVGSFNHPYTAIKDRAYFDQFIEKAGLKEKVHVTGWLPANEIPGYLSQAHVGVILIEPWCYSFEISVPDKLIDMLACGLPVIASDELIEVKHILTTHSCGLTASVMDHKSISDKIVSLLKNENIRKKMKNNALQYVQSSHSFEKYKKSLELVIHDVLEN